MHCILTCKIVLGTELQLSFDFCFNNFQVWSKSETRKIGMCIFHRFLVLILMYKRAHVHFLHVQRKAQNKIRLRFASCKSLAKSCRLNFNSIPTVIRKRKKNQWCGHSIWLRARCIKAQSRLIVIRLKKERNKKNSETWCFTVMHWEQRDMSRCLVVPSQKYRWAIF